MPEVEIPEVARFMEACLSAAGAPAAAARGHAALLLHADLAGHYSHGLNRLELYVNDCQSGATDPAATPAVLRESAATAWVDGRDALGATVGEFCMDLAIRKAKECGVGWVAAKRCNHFGMAGWWARRAEREGLIGLAFTNSSPVMVPTRATQSSMGTNPIAMCAPATGGDSLLVDMASTVVAMGKIEVAIHRGERIPAGWALGPGGTLTTDAQLAFDTGRLLPLGGLEQTGGHKGYCLSAMVEAFCSGLSGSKSSHQIRGWAIDSTEGAPDLGQCFAAIDPARFAPGFGDRVAACLQFWRNMEPMEATLPVVAPGDAERAAAAGAAARGTLAYADTQILACHALADRINVKPITVCKM